MKNMYKEMKTEMNIDIYSRNAGHQAEYLENIHRGTMYVLLHITAHDHHITNKLMSPKRKNIEVPWSVLNFSESIIYPIRIG